DTPVRIFDELDADAKCGTGSLAALGARKAFAQGKLGGIGLPEIWVCPCAEPAAGTAAVYTATITGPATGSGDLVLEIAGRLITVGVTAGDAANTIAAAIKSECDRVKATLPVVATVATNVVTLTFPTKGVNGNDVSRSTVRSVPGVTVAHAAPTPGAGATVIAGALAALYDQRYHGIVLANHAASDAVALLADAGLAWGTGGGGMVHFRFYFLGERGALGAAQTLQAAFNDYRFLIISAEGTPSLPVELATAAAVAEWSRESPVANLDGERLAITPPPASLVYTDPEIESALAGGVTPLSPDGPFMKIERLITTQITVNGAPFEALRDIAYARLSAFMAEQNHIGWLIGFKQENLYADPDGGDDIKKRVRDMVIDKHRAAERLHYIRDVDSFLESIQVEEAASPPGRLLVSDPFRAAGPVHQGVFIHTQYL
ncbi:MAG: hypothetical protein ACTHU0_01380, partial [Kofleriaceae bacterium]